MTKRAASGPFGTFCHHVVTKRAGETKRAGSASNVTRFVTLVTKRAVVTKRAATGHSGSSGAPTGSPNQLQLTAVLQQAWNEIPLVTIQHPVSSVPRFRACLAANSL